MTTQMNENNAFTTNMRPPTHHKTNAHDHQITLKPHSYQAMLAKEKEDVRTVDHSRAISDRDERKLNCKCWTAFNSLQSEGEVPLSHARFA